MTSNVLQHRHFDLRQAINFAVEPIKNDDLDRERLRWRGRDDCWHYAAQFHVFLSCGGPLLQLRSMTVTSRVYCTNCIPKKKTDLLSLSRKGRKRTDDIFWSFLLARPTGH